MEALGIFKFWRHAAAGSEASCDDGETDDDHSLFDFDFNGGACGKRDEDLKDFIESPRDVFLSKIDFTITSKPPSPVAMLRSAPMFKVFMLGFKKTPRSEKIRAAEAPVFGRDNSLRSKMLTEATSPEVAEKSLPKYLKLIKPFYAKAKHTDSATPSSSPVNPTPRKFGEVSRVGSFKIMPRSLGKSRSASVADGAAPPSIRRRDDSLLEQQHDGIQGAILHCKRSYNNAWEDQKRCSI